MDLAGIEKLHAQPVDNGHGTGEKATPCQSFQVLRWKPYVLLTLKFGLVRCVYCSFVPVLSPDGAVATPEQNFQGQNKKLDPTLNSNLKVYGIS